MSYFLPAGGETLHSYYIRRNVAMSFRLFKEYKVSKLTPIDLISYCDYLDDPYLINLKYEEIVKNNTHSPILLPTSYCPDFDHKSLGMYLPKYKLSEKIKCPLLACPDCVLEQIEECGYPWIKRDWLINNISLCFKHHRKLHYVDSYFFERPEEYILNPKYLRIDKRIYDIDSYHKFIHFALEKDYPYFSAALMVNLLIKSSKSQSIDCAYKYCLDIKKSMRQSLFYSEALLKSVFHYNYDYMPYELFWNIIADGFENTKEFDDYINDVSTKKKGVIKKSISGRKVKVEEVPIYCLDIKRSEMAFTEHDSRYHS